MKSASDEKLCRDRAEVAAILGLRPGRERPNHIIEIIDALVELMRRDPEGFHRKIVDMMTENLGSTVEEKEKMQECISISELSVKRRIARDALDEINQNEYCDPFLIAHEAIEAIKKIEAIK